MMSRTDVRLVLLWSAWLVHLATGASNYIPSIATPESSALVCEDSFLELDCERKNGIIRIARANYGRFSLGSCNKLGATNEWDIRCILPESKRIVAERCDGRSKCQVQASNSVFGDPCVGTYKYLQVYYTCEPIVITLPPKVTTELSTTTTAVTTTSTTKATTTAAPPKRVCDARYFEGKEWPYTKVGDEASVDCHPPRVGRMTWKCTGSGWRGERPDDSQCRFPATDAPVRSTPKTSQFCQMTESLGVIWPRIKVGEVVSRPCPDDKHGEMTWKCTGKGWRGKFPDTSNCVSPWLNTIDQLVNSSSSNIEDVADKLKKQTKAESMGAGDLKKMSNIITKMGQAFKIPNSTNKEEKHQKLEKFTKDIAETGSNVLSEKQSSSWEELPENNKTTVAASFLVSMETTGFHIADNLEEEETIVSSNENLFMEVSAVKITKDKPNVTYPSSKDPKWKDDQITIPMENIEAMSDKGFTKVVVFVYQNMDDLMKTDDDMPINSNILSASIMSRNSVSLRKPVTFTLKLSQAFNDSVIPTCAYWEFRDSHWSTSGCWRLSFNQSHATCQCSHLTNFAVLMDVTGSANELSLEHEFALMVITYFGCFISIICLLLSFITFCYFRNLQCDRNTIHKNLVLTLMLAEIVFVVGISLTQNRVVCGIVAGLLHFLFLAAFAWMCLEGYQLYVMLIEVFEGERSRRKWYYLFGYGIPLVTVAVTAGLKPSGYGTDKHCWLDTGSPVTWSFAGPALAVILFNLVMLSMAVYIMHKHANTLALAKGKSKYSSGILRDSNSGTSYSTTMTEEKSRTARQIPSWVKGAAILVVLLGLTWVFGVLYINQDSVIMAYIFTFLNSFQGLFIFIFHCLMNEKVKKEYKKFAYKSTWLPDCVRSWFIGRNSPSLSHTPNNSSSSGGYLLKLWSGRRRRKSSSSTLDKSSKGKKRISEPRSDSSVFTSHDLNTPIVRNSSCNGRQLPKESNGYLEPNNHEYEAILGDLSEVNCSVIDSEYVSEYCQKELQVSRETKDYSSESDNEEGHEQFEKNRLSILSEDSTAKNDSDFGVSQQNITETEFLLEKTLSEKNLLNKTQDEKSHIHCDSLGKRLYPGSFSEIHGYLSDGEELNHSMPLIPHYCPPDSQFTPTAGNQSSLPRLHIVEETHPGDKNNNSSEC